ncbi:MAG: CDP-alcohol phosphatidyltransferase family protein [archaeon]
MVKFKNIWKERYKDYKEPYDYLFARLFSYPFTVLFYYVRLTPNMVSLISFLVTLLASYFIVIDKLILGGILVWIGLVLDFSDGEVARLRNMQSEFGAWFDAFLDRIGELFLFGAIIINVYSHNPKIYILVLCLMAFISTTLWRYFNLVIKTSFKENREKNYDERAKHKFGYDVVTHNLIISLAAFFNQLFFLVIFFAVVMNLAWIKNIITTFFKHYNS